ncbi:MAG: hypothetical protein HOM21_07805 [Halobacteriovoraceae bacterium]|nr:hypothetical protein [Halobacteriovoraceae bacterium]
MTERILGTISYAANYNAEAATTFVNKMLKKTALNQLATKRPKFMTPKEALEVLEGGWKNMKKGERFHRHYRAFLKKRKRFSVAQVEENLDRSFHHFYRSTKTELQAYNGSISESDHSKGSAYIVDPNWLKLRTEKTRQRLSERITLYEYGMKGKSIGFQSLVTGKMINSGESFPITSDVTGEQVKVNLKALFRYQKDLKYFLPTHFKGKVRGAYTKRTNKKAVKKFGKKVWQWHYTYGKPLQWPDPTFGNFLPDNTNENIFTTMRILKQTMSVAPYIGYLPVP